MANLNPSCGKPEILLWPNEIPVRTVMRVGVKTLRSCRKYMHMLTRKHSLNDVKTVFRCVLGSVWPRTRLRMAMDSTPDGRGLALVWHGAKPICPWQGRRVRMDVQDGAVRARPVCNRPPRHPCGERIGDCKMCENAMLQLDKPWEKPSTRGCKDV